MDRELARMEQMESQATIGLMFTGPTANVLKESALDLELIATLELDLDLIELVPELGLLLDIVD